MFRRAQIMSATPSAAKQIARGSGQPEFLNEFIGASAVVSATWIVKHHIDKIIKTPKIYRYFIPPPFRLHF
jgi:hypothetical protein